MNGCSCLLCEECLRSKIDARCKLSKFLNLRKCEQFLCHFATATYTANHHNTIRTYQFSKNPAYNPVHRSSDRIPGPRYQFRSFTHPNSPSIYETLIPRACDFSPSITTTISMPPKRVAIQPARRQPKSEGYISSIYQTLTSEDNASVVISVAMFGVSNLFNRSCCRGGFKSVPGCVLTEHKAAVTFLSSSWSDFLLPEF